MSRLRTLRARFALWTAGLLLLALALFGVFVYANMSRSLTAAVDDTLRLAATQVRAETDVRDGQLRLSENPVEEPQFAPLREQGLSVRLVTRDGRVVQEYGPYTDLPPELAADAAGQLTSYVTATDPATQEPIRVYSTPVITEDGQVAGMLQVAVSMRTVRRTLTLLLVTLLLGGPLMVVMAGAGGYLLAARALAPIDTVTRTARRISASDLSARLDLPATDDEVGRLVATFDSMLARLDDAFRRERQFTADASHELRTPLAAMKAIIGGTLARRRTPSEYEQALRDLGHEAEQMRLLTEGLLHLARTDGAQHAERFEQVDLALLLHDVVESLRPLAEEKGLRLSLAAPDELILAADSDGLIRLFMNLLDNALKYTERGAIAVVAEARGGDSVEVRVSDTGVGIAPEHIPHIFERFYRVDESRSKEGIGLGLAIAQSIARAHGGHIAVQSDVGRGTTFLVRLPARAGG